MRVLRLPDARLDHDLEHPHTIILREQPVRRWRCMDRVERRWPRWVGVISRLTDRPPRVPRRVRPRMAESTTSLLQVPLRRRRRSRGGRSSWRKAPIPVARTSTKLRRERARRLAVSLVCDGDVAIVIDRGHDDVTDVVLSPAPFTRSMSEGVMHERLQLALLGPRREQAHEDVPESAAEWAGELSDLVDSARDLQDRMGARTPYRLVGGERVR